MGHLIRSRHFDNLDASENAFFEEQVWFIKQRLYNRKYPALKARQFIPIDNSIDRATPTVKIRGYSQVGMAKLLATYADDLPRSDVKADEMDVSIKGLGGAYGYGLDEVRFAAKAGINLDMAKGAAARRSIEVQIDRILASGDTATGMLGFFNQPNALSYTVAPGASGFTDWDHKTPDEIINDMVGILEFIVDQTVETEAANALILPRKQFAKIRVTKFSNISDKSIIGWFRDTYPGVMIDTWYKAKGTGAGGTDRMVAYTLDPDHIQGIIPQEFEQLPVQERNLEFLIPCHARIGGVAVYYPLSMSYGDGI